MLKEIVIVSMLASSFNVNYLGVNSIEYYQNNKANKEIIFDFDSDYYNKHIVTISINLYKNNEYYRTYSNQLEVIGNKKGKAKFEFEPIINSYALIDVKYGELMLVEKAKFNFYIQDDCLINSENLLCQTTYKSTYIDEIRDHNLNFIFDKEYLNKFLIQNFINLENIKFTSDYNFNNSNIYLLIKNRIDEYDIYYDDGYKFFLDIEGDKMHHFTLLEEYFVDVINFKFSEKYNEKFIPTKKIYFPYLPERRQYNLSIVIDDFIKIVIDLKIITDGLLLGDCDNSKFCLLRVEYDQKNV